MQGPQWSMASTNPAYDQARRAAADDARNRAQSYAQALDLTSAPVACGRARHAHHPGAGRRPRRPRSPGSAMRLAAAEVLSGPSVEPEPVEDLTPSELTVEVAVEVGFHIV